MEYNMIIEASKAPRPRLMRVQEACAYIGVGNTKFYDLVKRGLIEVRKIDGATRVVTESVDRYVDDLPSNINPSKADRRRR
jgi:excisionase family DNA binding protein